MHDDSDLDADGGAEEESPAVPQPPHETVVEPADTVVEAGELDGEVDDTTFTAGDELQDEFVAEQLATALAPDGLPDHGTDPVGAGALPYTIEAVTCIADERQYVELFVEELPARGWRPVMPKDAPEDAGPERAHWIPPGHEGLTQAPRVQLDVARRFDTEGMQTPRRVFVKKEVGERWGQPFVGWVPVRPIREQCVHYRRQHFGLEDQPDAEEPGHNMFMLMCTHPARRSVAGAAMRLNNEAVYGCDFREPADPRGTQFMDTFYQRKIDERPDLVRLPLFGLPGDEVHTEEDGRAGGIFE